jgi:hypothetical protein
MIVVGNEGPLKSIGFCFDTDEAGPDNRRREGRAFSLAP